MTGATILLLSVDEAQDLRRSLPAALAQAGAEVVVVDNACRDDTAEFARDFGARVLALPERLSYAAALNRAIAQTRGDAVLLLNADCVLAPGFLAAALPRLGEPGIGSVAPRLLRLADGRIDTAGMVVDRRRKNGLVGHGAPPERYAVAGECFGADGACALYRRDVLEQCAVGTEVLDEDMALWASDADLAWRARRLGWHCAYEPAAEASHRRTYSPSTRAGLEPAHRRLQFRNRYLMWVHNEAGADLMRDLPLIAAYELAQLAYVLVRERELLPAYAEAWALRGGAWRRRRALRARPGAQRVGLGLRPRP